MTAPSGPGLPATHGKQAVWGPSPFGGGKVNAMKWKRCWEDHHIAGYISKPDGEYHIVKHVNIEDVSCVVTEQGSEKASAWILFDRQGNRRLGIFDTLYEAKSAAE